ncbi:hypothetical protein DGMP_22440 [Desulfomarina profundi]|uniref:AAA+ ATPase domain-containing protein n=1 Tax=Desulfomarina profundi TaxID=2772557 RepID=A0A8D5JRZ6_9BACT|nr:AAA family ATPase [Desulfomarina profundi]BCL61551.1 hypothetical protein DGMP_22440 [Desulfomarina profundi]
MYLEFYHLNRAPFQICNDPESLWEGRNYTCSRDIINYCLMNPGKTGLITGDTGTGKSYTVHAILKSMDRNISTAIISNIDFSVEDFYNQVRYAFQLPSQMGNRHEIIKFFHKRATENLKTLLILDEVQLLSRELTTEIIQLAEMQNTDPFRLSICLVGQPGNSAIEESADIRYHFVPLSLDKTTRYLRHRLQVAGATREIFTRDAISAIYRFSRGYPVMINALCDLALYFGCGEQKIIIDEAVIQQTIRKFHFTEKQKNSAPRNTRNVILSKKKAPLSRKKPTPDTAEKNQKTKHFFFKFCIVTLLLLLLVEGGYMYYKTNPRLADDPSTRLNTTETPSPVNDIKSPLAPAHQNSDYDAIGYPSENRLEKNTVVVTAASSFPADSILENDRKKSEPKQINSLNLGTKASETDAVAANETPFSKIQPASTDPVNPIVPIPETKAKPQSGSIPVPRSDPKLNLVLKQKRNIKKKKIQTEKTANTLPEKIAEKRMNRTAFTHRRPVFAPNPSPPKRIKKHPPPLKNSLSTHKKHQKSSQTLWI